MTMLLDDDQVMARELAGKFFAQRSGVGAFRRLRAAGEAFDRTFWAELAEVGLASIAIAAGHGGAGLGYAALAACLEEAGRQLCTAPMLGTSVLAASVLAEADGRATQLLSEIAAGRAIVSLVCGASGDAPPVGARSRDGSFVLDGRGAWTIDATAADYHIVHATVAAPDSAERSALFLVPASAAGICAHPAHMIDGRHLTDLHFDSVEIAADAELGLDSASATVDRALDRARICLAAEMLGSALELFDRTLVYLRDRQQFGVRIGTFQALQHRAARMFVELELAISVAREAASAIDTNAEALPRLASLAKARVNDVALLIGNEAIQMHGGVGVTDELDVGLFVKRLSVSARLLGSARFHRNRYADLSGY